jgi:intracellular septation protein
MLATAVGIVATVLQIGYLLVRGRKVDGMLWLSLGVIAVMGGATIYFHDENFIKWKPTILYWAFALALAVAQLGFRNNLMRKVMEANIQLPDAVWDRVGYAWMGFLAAMGALNLFVAFVVFRANTSAWVSFKLFGFTAIFFVFIFVQMLFLSKHMKEDA